MPPDVTDDGLPKPPLEIGSYFAGYKVLELIGQGGHACVFRVLDEFLDKSFALKVLYRAGGVTPEMMKRGKSEAQFLSSLRHPHVVEVLRAGVENGLLFIVMELLQGRSLRLIQQLAGRLEVEEVLTIAEHIAEGVGAAHHQQAIHRDLKPDNVFICSGNRGKVLDFGIAKLVGQGGWTTQRNIVPGTMLYMSPEQLLGMPLGPESDIYAVGLLMFTLLFGRHPCLLDTESVSNDELVRIQVVRVPPHLDQIAPHIPRYVARLVAKALAKRPEERFSSMNELVVLIREVRERYVGETRRAGKVLQTRDLSSCDLSAGFEVSLVGRHGDAATITDRRGPSPLIVVAAAGHSSHPSALRTVEYGSPPSRRAPTNGDAAAPTSADKPTIMARPGQSGHFEGSAQASAAPALPVRSVVFESRVPSRATPTPSPTSLGRTAPPHTADPSRYPGPSRILQPLGAYRLPVLIAICAGAGMGLGLAVVYAVRHSSAAAAAKAAQTQILEPAAAARSVTATQPPRLPAPSPPAVTSNPIPPSPPDEAPPASAVTAAPRALAARATSAPPRRSAPVASQRLMPSEDDDQVLERMKATAKRFHEEAERAKNKPASKLPFGDDPESGL